MNNNKLVIAAAGSGKTTYLVDKAKSIKDENVLITTYTEANEAEIKKKFNGRISPNITIQTWFSFLLKHGVRPYQSILEDELHNKRVGFYLTEKKSGLRYYVGKRPVYWGEDNFFKYYFTNQIKIYSDKISRFIIKCNERIGNEVIDRISRIYPNIFIDEVQDLAGWELEILKMLFNSNSNILLVGDPRQVIYLTHTPQKYAKYKYGKIKEFIESECTSGICEIDTSTFNFTHRNNKEISEFASKLYPEYDVCTPCKCKICRDYSKSHEGIFLVKEKDVNKYCRSFSQLPIILRFNNSVFPDWNFGKSKGLTFDRVLIYPTQKIRNYLINGDISKIETVKAKFYVALTRARYSVGIVINYNDTVNYIDGLQKYSC